MSNIKTKQFINILFDKGEWTCIGHKFDNKTSPVDTLLYEQHEYVSINPMKKGSTRKGTNVTKFRNFLFEMDTFSKRDQIQMIKNSGLPWSTMVDSGNKSIHFIVSLEDALEDRTMYLAYFKAIQKVLDKFGATIDSACKDPGRFTRAPHATRSDNGQEQKVLRIAARHKLAEIDEWLTANEIDVNDYIPKVTVNDGLTVSTVDAQLKWDWVQKYYMKNEEYKQGNRHNYQVKMVYYLYRTGLDANEIQGLLIKHFGEVSSGIHSIEQMQSDVQGNPIYVPSMEERREYYRQLDDEELRMHVREGYNRPELPKEIQIRPEDTNRYIIVGTEYFKIESVGDKLIPWTKTVFEKMYGSRAIPSRLYDKFGYQPDYVSEPFPVEIGPDLRTYNSFIRPGWQMSPGNWDTIKHALEHGFGDLYQFALEYAAISIAFPEAKLPVLWFLGPENKGKSAVIAIFRELVGVDNTKKISNKIIEDGYTDFLGGSQLVIVEEAGNWKNPTAVMSNLKDWVTEMATQKINPKYGKQYEAPIHAKFIFSSNDSDAIPITGEATRFCILNVDQEPKHKVSDYYNKIKEEIGHFAHYLINEIVPTLRLKDGRLDTKHRLYFATEEYANSKKDQLKELNKSEVYEDLSSAVMQFFSDFPEEQECYVDLKSIKDRLGYKYKWSPGNKEIKKSLADEFRINPTSIVVRPDHFKWEKEIASIGANQPSRQGKWFVFQRAMFFKDGEELVQASYF